MPKTTGIYKTANASKYLEQLCKHFAHKVEVEYSEHEGHVKFPMRDAYLSADDTSFNASINLTNQDAKEMAHKVIDKHLENLHIVKRYVNSHGIKN